MKKILFICLGNICRSPMAKFIFRDIVNRRGLSDEYYIDSAATSYEEIGNEMYGMARQELKNKNILFDTHKARRITKEDYNKFDYIIGMDERNIRDIKRILGEDIDNKIYKLLDFTNDSGDIEDPWYTRRFEKVYNQIYEGCNALLDKIEE